MGRGIQLQQDQLNSTTIVQTSGSVTSGNIAVFDGTSGSLIKNDITNLSSFALSPIRKMRNAQIPSSASFTILNAGSISVTDTSYGVEIRALNTNNEIKGLSYSVGATYDYAYAVSVPFFDLFNFQEIMFYFGESSSGKYRLYRYLTLNRLDCYKFSNSTTYDSADFETTTKDSQGLMDVISWWRLKQDASNHYIYGSLNGYDWKLFDTKANNNWFSTRPDIIGIGLDGITQIGGGVDFHSFNSLT